MRTIITVTEYSSMSGRYVVKCDALCTTRGIVPSSDIFGPEAAAAKAMEYAMSAHSSGYVIFAPRAVLACIPADMQSRA